MGAGPVASELPAPETVELGYQGEEPVLARVEVSGQEHDLFFERLDPNNVRRRLALRRRRGRDEHTRGLTDESRIGGEGGELDHRRSSPVSVKGIRSVYRIYTEASNKLSTIWPDSGRRSQQILNLGRALPLTRPYSVIGTAMRWALLGRACGTDSETLR